MNRGDVSDEAFLLFYAIEDAMRGKLKKHLSRSILMTSEQSEEAKAAIIQSVVNDCDVLYRWGFISDIDDDDESTELQHT